jgi:hypothetical protein
MYYLFKLKLKIIFYAVLIVLCIDGVNYYQPFIFLFVMLMFGIFIRMMMLIGQVLQYGEGVKDAKSLKSKRRLLGDEDYNLGFNSFVNKKFDEQNRRR